VVVAPWIAVEIGRRIGLTRDADGVVGDSGADFPV